MRKITLLRIDNSDGDYSGNTGDQRPTASIPRVRRRRRVVQRDRGQANATPPAPPSGRTAAAIENRGTPHSRAEHGLVDNPHSMCPKRVLAVVPVARRAAQPSRRAHLHAARVLRRGCGPERQHRIAGECRPTHTSRGESAEQCVRACLQRAVAVDNEDPTGAGASRIARRHRVAMLLVLKAHLIALRLCAERTDRGVR